MHPFVFTLAFFASSVCAVTTNANDWPMWRYDAARSAASPHGLPDDLQLMWTKTLSARKQVWDDPLNLDLMTYDRVFEPIVLDGRLFIGFNDLDKLMAVDARTGQELWSFYAEGPVRLPPVGWRDRVFFCSDDGVLYCVDAKSGKLVWKFSGAPHPQHAIGNSRLISAWPARGGPVVRDQTVYFSASIWPFMGTFIYALDAETGEVDWVNDSTGAQYIKQPHSAPAFAGVAPQGAFVATENDLIVPGGRSVPAVFDRRTGDLRYFELDAGGKGTGGSFVAADEGHFYVHTREKGVRSFEISKGVKTAFQVNEPVLRNGIVYSSAIDDDQQVVRAYRDEKPIWQIEADASGDLIIAGDRLYAAGVESITTIELPSNGDQAKVIRSIPVTGSVQRLIAANDQLFAVTLEGSVLAFGANEQLSRNVVSDAADMIVAPDEMPDSVPVEVPDEVKRDAKKLLEKVDDPGFALWYGNASRPLAHAVAKNSHFLQLAIIAENNESFPQIRSLLDDENLSGRVTLHHRNAKSFYAPQYVAHFVHVDGEIAQDADAELMNQLYQSVRPYGGIMHIDGDRKLADRFEAMNLEQAKVEHSELGIFVTRVGALPGSADWTHQYGDIANSVKSDDARVKLPLGVLWFGGNSNMDVLPRHGHGPPEQVVGGRLFIQGMDMLSARDVYTGRILWERKFDNLGTFDVYFDDTYENVPLDPKYNQVHIPGANARGTNYVVTEDRVYVVEGNICHALDPATGQTLTEMHLPADTDGDIPDWGYIGVYEDVLIGGVGFANYRDRHSLEFPADEALKRNSKGFGSKCLDRAASLALIGLDRRSGEKLWRVDAHHSFWHNGIVAGGGKIYCLDKNPQQVEDAMRRRGKSNPSTYRILAIDAATGTQQWEITENIFGTWLGYSREHDLLLQAGANASDRLSSEAAQGMAVYAGSDGSVRWKNDDLKYAGPCILHNGTIITNSNSYRDSAGAFSLITGEQKMVRHPLTGVLQPWTMTRSYGCNTVIAAENFLTFRSGAAAFYDLLSEAGTGNLGGFKSGCTSNLVVANGVLNAPDYTRTCSCAYQNQTSLALVHMPNMEMWSVSADASVETEQLDIVSWGINFGAPGDRRDANGLLWLEHPSVAGGSAAVDIQINDEATYFQNHSSRALQSELPWVSASGVDGITNLRVRLKLGSPSSTTDGIAIDDVNDDAEESGNGQVNLTSSDLELTEDGVKQIVGLRFNGIPLTKGSRIRNAYIQFTCDETSSGDTTLIVAAENSGTSKPFEDSRHNLSARSRTKQEIGWKPESWKTKGAAKEEQRTPNLSQLIEEVITRPDWRPGSSLAFLITGSGKRIAASYKKGADSTPRLIIDADEVAPGDSQQPAKTANYDVTLHFASSVDDQSTRIFDVYVGGQLKLKDVTLDGKTNSVTHRLADVAADESMHFKFIASQGQAALAGIEIRKNQ